MPIFRIKNENFFKKWSPDMAYVLGFFTADGSMIKNKRGAHFIEFQITDRDLLFKIRKTLGSEHKIATRKRNGNWKTIYRLQIGSGEMFNDLLALGMLPRKSKIISLPEIPDKYFSHFLRGYFDGDGNVVSTKYRRADRNNRVYTTVLSGFTSGSKIFLEKMHTKIKRLAGVSGGTLYFHGRGHRLFFSVKDSLSLYNFMYNGSEKDLFLARKKKIFEKYFNIG